MSTTWTIAKREFRSYFDSPVAYVVICLGLAALGLLFFNYRGGFWDANRASLEQMFIQVPRGLSWLVVPVITMRLIAEEKHSGTLELLITLPVRDSEVIFGKFLGAWGLVLVFIAATGLYPILMFGWPWDLGSLDTGPVLSGYLGLALFSAAAVSIGLLISSLTESQVIAFFVTFLVLFMLHIVGSGMTLDMLPPRVEYVVTFISFETRIAGFLRGAIHARDILFFLTVTAGCLTGSFWALERRKWA
ncbi:MAG: ABC transporter permease [Myxococcales bacterium]|nr:ABC transporter permease [Myxococcales bacterium]